MYTIISTEHPPVIKMSSNLAEIESIVDQLLKKIEDDVETQFDDVVSLMTDLGGHFEDVPEKLETLYESLYREIYCSKGAMYDVRSDLAEIKDHCFQQRLFNILVWGDS